MRTTLWKRLATFALLAVTACGANDEEAVDSAGGAFVDGLPVRRALPDLMASDDDPSRRVMTSEDFQTWRSEELRTLFRRYVYGFAPPAPTSVDVEPIAHAVVAGGSVVYDEYAVRFDPARERPLHLAIFSPVGIEHPPVILGPNKCGNQSIVPDEAVRVTTSFVHGDCGGKAAAIRGRKAGDWPVATIAARGFALATFHESDAAPDSSSQAGDGFQRFFPKDDPATGWGAIATWAWANSRAVDALGKLGTVDAKRIAVYGHSRRGKTALWTGANDPRIGAVIAHQSGRAGAALSRSDRGESIFAINFFFPHWFNDNFTRFAWPNANRLPIDQHELIALSAPRPVLLLDGDGDDHADPRGARAAAEAAAPAWNLFGDPGLVPNGDGTYRRDGTLVWTTRPGKHSIEASDWTIFLDFAATHLGS